MFEPTHCRLWLSVNGEVRQKGNTKNMIFKIPQLIEYISSKMRLEVGDMILTGTPAGVGELKHGDTVVARLSHDYVIMKYHVVNGTTIYEKNRWMQNHLSTAGTVYK